MRKLYHATHYNNRESILKSGLEPRFSKRYRDIGDGEKRIYLFEDLDSNVLDFVGYDGIDIWEVNLDDSYVLHNDLMAKEDGVDKCYYINKHIPVNSIRIFKTIIL